jgi:hypothetical protein
MYEKYEYSAACPSINNSTFLFPPRPCGTWRAWGAGFRVAGFVGADHCRAIRQRYDSQGQIVALIRGHVQAKFCKTI